MNFLCRDGENNAPTQESLSHCVHKPTLSRPTKLGAGENATRFFIPANNPYPFLFEYTNFCDIIILSTGVLLMGLNTLNS